MVRTVFSGALLGAAIALAGCGGGVKHPQPSAAPAVSSQAPRDGAGVVRLRAALARALAQRDEARAQLRAALAYQRELQARLGAIKPAPSHAQSHIAKTEPQIFTNLSTSQNP